MSDYDQWVTKCPKCGQGGSLLVVECKLSCNGKKIHPHTSLHSDGFEVDPRNELPRLMGDQSTEDEKVLCIECEAVFEDRKSVV